MTGPAMILQRTPTWAKVTLAALLGALLMWGVSCFQEAERKEQAESKVKSDSLVIVVAQRDSAMKLAVAHTDTVIQDRVIYTDRILAGNRPSIPRSEVVELANRCAEVESSCKKQAAAAQSLIDDLKLSLATEKKRVALMPPRLKLSVEGGWGFIDRAMPFNGRGELRLVGPISLVGSAGVRVPTDTGAVRGRADLLVSYTFGRR